MQKLRKEILLYVYIISQWLSLFYELSFSSIFFLPWASWCPIVICFIIPLVYIIRNYFCLRSTFPFQLFFWGFSVKCFLLCVLWKSFMYVCSFWWIKQHWDYSMEKVMKYIEICDISLEIWISLFMKFLFVVTVLCL